MAHSLLKEKNLPVLIDPFSCRLSGTDRELGRSPGNPGASASSKAHSISESVQNTALHGLL
jgi:hypothetical protein